jgi:predicted dehydrogenase
MTQLNDKKNSTEILQKELLEEPMETQHARRTFLKTACITAIGATASQCAYFSEQHVYSSDARSWKVAVVQDTSRPTLGGHGLETAFRGLPNVEVVAHIDPNTHNIQQRMSVSQAKKHYPTLAAMFEQETPDIVVLTSRLPEDHLPQIRQVVEKGCHIYCEKPLTASLAEADEAVRLSEKHGIKIAVAHPRRYDLGYLTMKQLIEAGKIGIPMTIQGWAKSDHRGGGEDLLVLGTHILDLFVFLFGTPEHVSAEVYVQGKPFADQPLSKTVEPIGLAAGDEIFAVYRFPKGVHGIFESRRNLYAKKDFRMGISVIGNKGMLSRHLSDAHHHRQPLLFGNSPCSHAETLFTETIPLAENRIIHGAVPLLEAFGGKEKDITLGITFGEARRFAVWDLMRAIEENRQPVCSVYDARIVMEMIYGVYASHLRKTPVAFPLQDRTHPLKDTSKNSQS